MESKNEKIEKFSSDIESNIESNFKILDDAIDDGIPIFIILVCVAIGFLQFFKTDYLKGEDSKLDYE